MRLKDMKIIDIIKEWKSKLRYEPGHVKIASVLYILWTIFSRKDIK